MKSLYSVLEARRPKQVRDIWLKVEFEGEELRSTEIDAEETEKTKKRIAEKLERLRRGDHLK
jgi:hypothetical protein